MAPIQPARPEADEPGRGPGRRRRAARYAVPVAVAGVAVATISLVPALADAGDPSLPSITAQQLLTKIAGSDTRTVDGSVKVTADLGLPSALSGGGSLLGGAAPSGVPGLGSGGSPAAPQSQITQLLIGSHQLHVAADGPDRQKLSLIEPAAEYSVIHNGNQLWAYDSESDQAYHQTLPQRSGAGTVKPQDFPATPQAAAQQALKAAEGTASITVDGTARVAGHSAYQLLITPQHADTTTVGAIRIAVDAGTGVPLRFTLSPKGGGKAIFDIGFTKVSFAAPAASTFAFTPGKGVKVTEGGTNGKAQSGHGTGFAEAAPDVAPDVIGKGWDSIAVIRTGSGLPSGAAKSPTAKSFPAKGGEDSDAQSMLDSFGTKVSGSYGTGTLFHTRLVNALLTDDGTLYAGAVTESALTDAANAADTAK
ncbi:outer membrane lipoprotein carrier protein LolA [Streptomyces polygonati]|uniref:Outer membrane lipoprotein carrier protein LolA n=1 Tax=Streptomyces polygonati TaxID=1617087 RepID=A0ABV8HM04_9ACTN